MKTLGILLLLSSSAMAQSIDWSNGACYSNGIYFPARHGPKCVNDDRSAFSQTAPPSNLLGVINGDLLVTGSSSAYVTNTPAPKCPDGYSMVLRSPGDPACARDIIDPIR